MLTLAKGWLRWRYVAMNREKKGFFHTVHHQPEDNVIEWKFDIGQMVQVRRSKMIGMVTTRELWSVNYQGYEVQMGRYLLYFLDYEIEPTNKKVISTVSIHQLNHKRLVDGTYFVKTKRPIPYPTTHHYPQGFPFGGIRGGDCSIGW